MSTDNSSPQNGRPSLFGPAAGLAVSERAFGARLAEQLDGAPGPAPVDDWQTPLSGEMDLRIDVDGRWYHQGREIHRRGLKQLFAGILRRDEDGHHYLVTPVERWRIRVADAPFLAVALQREGDGRSQTLSFLIDLAAPVTADPQHPLRVVYRQPDGEPRPYLRVRGRLDALLTRAVFIELAQLAEPGRDDRGNDCYGVWSGETFFPLGPLD